MESGNLWDHVVGCMWLCHDSGLGYYLILLIHSIVDEPVFTLSIVNKAATNIKLAIFSHLLLLSHPLIIRALQSNTHM